MDTALFSLSSLFPDQDDSSDTEEEGLENLHSYVERMHSFPGMELLIREFSFHPLNANLLWPGAFAFAEWLVLHQSWIQGQRCIELGSGTGALAIFLRKSFDLDITTSDYNDPEIEENIAYNCRVNDISPPIPHINHTWGDAFPTDPGWDLVIASDILLYTKQYSNLIKTLCVLLKGYKPWDDGLATTHAVLDGSSASLLPRPAFLMSWRRRIGKEDESLFFRGCNEAGLEVEHLESRVYCISIKKNVLDVQNQCL
ncbi:hypothetical protein SAY87_010505 [Trapa incisa]|uniref:Uncharacterized protein n=1 Tax=Trapa incisa TaxID=236973 RepID=A0AAN7GH65_9MYRT|nr:hypothetical protein SAY87_010505 [Trapa incisa]